ncbi:M56 family metallopeptidase [Novosphingobium panipatense]|uniref:M56 family metallopeptidase n=1 Tax=Novosphingobium panipatense TaxID=428991 RepID=UPI00361AC470
MTGTALAEGIATPVAEPSFWSQVDFGAIVAGVWLSGAAAFIIWRALTYRGMRRDLLEGAKLVARADAVRIVETPAVRAPLAFGIFDKVIVLPQGFLAGADCEISDFVIAHELEHHKGNDLLALILMQPLFALHWFNPLAGRPGEPFARTRRRSAIHA